MVGTKQHMYVVCMECVPPKLAAATLHTLLLSKIFRGHTAKLIELTSSTDPPNIKMHLMYYLDESGKRVYTLKVRLWRYLYNRVSDFIRSSNRSKRNLCLHYCATMVVIFPHWRKKCVAVILFFLHLCFLPRSSQHLLFWIGRIKCNLANKYHNNKHQNKNLTSIKNRNSIQRTKLLNRPTLLGSHLMINSAVNG